MFGPNYTPPQTIKDINYGCERSITKQTNGNYIITAQTEEYCGVYSEESSYFNTTITNYYKKNNNIIITIAVAYVETTIDENEEEYYEVYTDKTKENLLYTQYDTICNTPTCIPNEQPKYEVILKKASDGKYYFNSITRI